MSFTLLNTLIPTVVMFVQASLFYEEKEHMLKETNYILYVFIEITEKKIVIWDAAITVLAVPALFF
jgi:hypothetical protein